jgi:transmembrane sensor
MKNNKEINWNILAKHFAGETDKQGQEEISEWMHESSSNSALYNEINTYWDHINSIKEMNQFDVNNGWEKLHNRINASSGSTAMVKGEKRRSLSSFLSMPLLKVAASVALLVLMGTAIYFAVSMTQKNSMLTVASSGSDDQTKVTLPDGTQVFLNTETKISYSKSFNTGNREVRLKGEAFFNVTPDPEKPFIIYTGKAGIKVLGTSFNVQSLKTSGKVEVFVESGKVQLFEVENISNTITIEPGFVGLFENTAIEKQKNTDENYLAWKTRRLVFNNTDLAKVAKGIQDVFKVKVVFENEAMSRCKIQSNFENESLENVIEAICTIHNWRWEIKSDKVILSGPGC